MNSPTRFALFPAFARLVFAAALCLLLLAPATWGKRGWCANATGSAPQGQNSPAKQQAAPKASAPQSSTPDTPSGPTPDGPRPDGAASSSPIWTVPSGTPDGNQILGILRAKQKAAGNQTNAIPDTQDVSKDVPEKTDQGQAANATALTNAANATGGNGTKAQSEHVNATNATAPVGNKTAGNATVPLATNATHTTNATGTNQTQAAPKAQLVGLPLPAPDKPIATFQAGTTGQGAFTTVITCAPLSGQLGRTRQQVAASLTQQGRSKAMDIFFHRLYTPNAKGELPHMEPGFKAHVLSLLEVVDQPRLFNGKGLGELCAQTMYSLPQHVFNQLRPRRMELKNFCYSAPELSLEAMRTQARYAAMDRMLLQAAPQYTALTREQRAMLLHNLKIKQLFDWFSNDMCMSASADIIPMQMEREINKALGRLPDAPPPAGPKVAYQLDLKGQDAGDPVPEWGKDIGVFTDFQGKCLGSTAPKGATALFPLTTGQDFDVSIFVANVFDLPQKPGKSARFPLFSLRYENGLWEDYSLIAGYDDKLQPQAVYRVGSIVTNTLPWIDAVNFNEYKVVKRGSLMKLFVNGQFVFYFSTGGNSLTGVRLLLPWKARLYDLVITEPGQAAVSQTSQTSQTGQTGQASAKDTTP
ncbi:MAG: hypothetical protein ACNI3A_11230 [Desulfovibrio sp.]|uniref:hypothetical protein n=1 Tax=Desulfovibrio sp. 7SRBS1 TaxID=3378064 RepID=UPI003B411CC4